MGTPATIVVQSGGSASQNESVTWENSESTKVHVTGLAGVVAGGEFHVDPASGGKNGQKLGSILPNAPVGDHVYTITPSTTATTATLKVNGSTSKAI
jgi:hypothetical protein